MLNNIYADSKRLGSLELKIPFHRGFGIVRACWLMLPQDVFCKLQEMLAALLESLHIEILLEGNISANQAFAMAKQVTEELPGKRLLISQRLQQLTTRLPAGGSYLLRSSLL